uniref:WWE domain-containing protein n=1 Tax=Macrostomum lignano TaxID=282301 RepID=A0A1I8F4D8_9PLAT
PSSAAEKFSRPREWNFDYRFEFSFEGGGVESVIFESLSCHASDEPTLRELMEQDLKAKQQAELGLSPTPTAESSGKRRPRRLPAHRMTRQEEKKKPPQLWPATKRWRPRAQHPRRRLSRAAARLPAVPPSHLRHDRIGLASASPAWWRRSVIVVLVHLRRKGKASQLEKQKTYGAPSSLNAHELRQPLALNFIAAISCEASRSRSRTSESVNASPRCEPSASASSSQLLALTSRCWRRLRCRRSCDCCLAMERTVAKLSMPRRSVGEAAMILDSWSQVLRRARSTRFPAAALNG